MDRTRVLGVTGPAVSGSGYLVTATLVLTSAHVVGELGSEATVFRPGHPGTARGRVQWRGSPGGRDDAALVGLERAVVDGVLPPVRWGRLVTDRPGTPGQTWGLPDVVQRRDRPAETVQPSGTVNPGDRAVGHRYVLSLDQPPPQGGSPWGGLSGAALFCGDLLAGVIASAPAGWGHARVEAVPTYVLLHDEGFRAALAEDVPGRAVLEPVEFQHVVEPAHTSAAPSAAALVQPRREVVPFRHRDGLLGELLGWAELPDAGVRLVHGPGGQGKTRLARELAGRLPEQWTAVWLDPRATREQLGAVAGAAVPLLVVVDYAESRIDQLGALFEACARHFSASPIKVLLLARSAGSWWENLPAESASAQEILGGAAAIPLPALEPEFDGRREGYRDAVAAFAAALPAVRGHADADWLQIAERLPDPIVEDSGYQGALTLHMTALADLLDAAYPDTGSSQDGAGDVEDRLLVHEQRYWTLSARARGLDQSLSMDTLTDALIAATVLDAATGAEAHAVLTRVPSLSDQPRTRVDAVRRWIADLYPPVVPERPWNTLQPDRLAERFLGRHIQRQPDFVDHLVIDLAEKPAERLLTLCSRAVGHPILQAQLGGWLTSLCVRHHATLVLPAVQVIVQVERPRPLLDALNSFVDNIPPEPESLDLLWRMATACPARTVVLSAIELEIYLKIVEIHLAFGRFESINDIESIAAAMVSASDKLAAIGRGQAALHAIQVAAHHFGTLAEQYPEVFLPQLAGVLGSLAGRMAECGRAGDAAATIDRALKISERLAVEDETNHGSLLAHTLTTFASLFPRSRPGESLAAMKRAVEIYEKRAAGDPGAEAALAKSLNDLCRLYIGSGTTTDATTAADRAASIYERLAAESRDAYQPGLAVSLFNLMACFAQQRQFDQALDAAERLLVTLDELASRDVRRFVDELASTALTVGFLRIELAKPDAVTPLICCIALSLIDGVPLKHHNIPYQAAEFIRKIYLKSPEETVIAWRKIAQRPLPDWLVRGEVEFSEEVWLRYAVDCGKTDAVLPLAEFLDGQGRLYEAEQFYGKAAAEGDVKAMLRAATLLRERDCLDAAVALLRDAAAAGDTDGMTDLAMILLMRGDWQEAEPMAQMGADFGNIRAMNVLGLVRLQQGNLEEGEDWLRKAAMSGNVQAANNLLGILRVKVVAGDDAARHIRGISWNIPR